MLQLADNILINGNNIDGMKLIEGLLMYDLVLVNQTCLTQEVTSKHFLEKTHALLNENGVIAMYIEANELANLKKDMDTVYGECNFIQTYILSNHCLVLYKKREEASVQNECESDPLFTMRMEKKSTKQAWIDFKRSCLKESGNSLDENQEIVDINKYQVTRILSAYTHKESNVLNLFSGKETLGRAILRLNHRDGGNRKFTLITNEQNHAKARNCYFILNRNVTMHHKKLQYFVMNE